MFLDPTKLLVISVVAIMVLGPEHLPTMARKFSTLRTQLSLVNKRLEAEARALVPDLPDMSGLGSALRSPSALLDHLSATVETPEALSPNAAVEPTFDTEPSARPAPAVDPFESWPRSLSDEPGAPSSPPRDDAASTASLT